MDETTIITELLGHGILGIAAIVLGLCVRALYKRNQELSLEKDRMYQDFQRKLEEISDKFISKIESLADKQREAAVQMAAVLQALLKRGEE